MRILIGLTILIGVGVVAAPAQRNADRLTWQEYCQTEIEKYTIFAKEKRERPLSKSLEPVFSHHNQDGRLELGSVFLWKDWDGRPVAIGTVIVSRRAGDPFWYDVHELHSLTDHSLEATYADKETWFPDAAGLTWKVIPDAPDPASDKAERHEQAKMLSLQFSASVKANGETWNLKAVEKPVYAYNIKSVAGGKSTTGGVFVHCHEKDPELFLQIEVRADEQGQPRWHYAAAAFNFRPTKLIHKGTEVWSVSLGRDVYKPTSHHFGIFRKRGIKLADPIFPKK